MMACPCLLHYPHHHRHHLIKRKKLLQWNLELTKCQGTGKIGSLNRGFLISRFIFHIFYCDLNSPG